MATPEALVKKREQNRMQLLEQTFGRLTILRYVGVTPSKKHYWEAACSCGKIVLVSGADLHAGDTNSCGCIKSELLAKRNKQSTDPWMREHRSTYNSYISARRRALEPTDKDFHRYGAVGIGFCPEWAKSFRLFVAHVGKRPLGTTLDRIDTSKGYVPGNVRWATPVEQAVNRKSTVWVEWNQLQLPLSEVARQLGVSDSAVRLQLKKKGTLDGYNPRRRS